MTATSLVTVTFAHLQNEKQPARDALLVTVGYEALSAGALHSVGPRCYGKVTNRESLRSVATKQWEHWVV